MSAKPPNNAFIEGPIPADKISRSISAHGEKTTIGAHEIFLGQVRGDEVGEQTVQAIEFTAYEEMAAEKFYEIREACFDKYDLTCAHIYHSLGRVEVGELCFFVMTSSGHRQEAREAVRFLVDTIKAEVPIFGKEIFGDDSHTWKENR